ncbi:MAG: autotransporter assembly complex family protein [Pseudomonadota bacterium]
MPRAVPRPARLSLDELGTHQVGAQMRAARERGVRRAAPVAVALLMAVVPASVGALDLFGIKLFERDEQGEPVVTDPQTYQVGVEISDGDPAVEKAVQRASRLWSDRDDPASGAAGLLAKARADYRRILAALYAEGRYGGTIRILVDGREAFELPPDANLLDPANVLILVEPGPTFLFNEALIVNRAPPVDDRRDQVAAPETEGFVTGEVARSGAVLRAERLGIDAWRELGYAKVRVVTRDMVADHNARTIDARVTLDPGRRAVYGPVSVEGTERMNPAFVARQTGLRPGVEYDPDDLDRARKRLARLGVFRATRLDEADQIASDGSLPITVVAQERKPRRIGVGVTGSTIDGAGVEAFWLHRNLFGQAERFRVDGKVGGIGDTIMPDEFDYSFAMSFLKPGVLTPDTDLILSVGAEREVLESYTETSASASVGLNHIVTDELTVRGAAFVERSRFEDDLGERDFTTVGLDTAATYDTRDNAADATTGIFAEATVRPFYETNYGNAAVRSTVEGRAYYGLGATNRVVFAGRLKVGALTGSPIDETPPDQLFFAGGGGSVRGYAYRNIGVSENGTLTGGRSLVEGSAEIRARFNDTFGAAAFADFGTVTDSPLPDFSGDFKVGVGLGIRYYTGLGPLRFDVAVPLHPDDGDPDFAFYIGLGQAF